jgi:hypothetical protein
MTDERLRSEALVQRTITAALILLALSLLVVGATFYT